MPKGQAENRYGFLKSGLKTDVENDIFWSEIHVGSGFGDPGGKPPTKNSQEYPCWGRISEWVSITFKMLSVSVKWST